ncbi:MAG: hypothetical protein BGO67_05430 [Alphaproteobacteria bacterium 41-28]|nr:MAG: hypothetical protein BGO67_05430 [Alphaproteobacteria bacterium 41-28]
MTTNRNNILSNKNLIGYKDTLFDKQILKNIFSNMNTTRRKTMKKTNLFILLITSSFITHNAYSMDGDGHPDEQHRRPQNSRPETRILEEEGIEMKKIDHCHSNGTTRQEDLDESEKDTLKYYASLQTAEIRQKHEEEEKKFKKDFLSKALKRQGVCLPKELNFSLLLKIFCNDQETKELFFNNQPLGTETWNILGKVLKDNKTLEKVTFKASPTTERVFNSLLERLSKIPTLTTLTLEAMDITSPMPTIPMQESIQPNSYAQRDTLRLDNVYFFGTNILANLKILDLSKNNLRCEGVCNLTAILPSCFPLLKILYLDENEIGDEGAKRLRRFLKMNKPTRGGSKHNFYLEEVHIYNNNISNKEKKILDRKYREKTPYRHRGTKVIFSISELRDHLLCTLRENLEKRKVQIDKMCRRLNIRD